LERDDFTNRLREQKPVAMHEILYPLCQGMDSVEIQADIELGGNDQKFNNLVGRNLMEQYGMPAQVVMLCPLLVGTDGKEKMSQSLGNYVSIVDTPNDVYGKTMSIPDDLIANWFELCTDVDMAEASAWIAANPYEAKKRLARELVHMYHGPQEAHAAEEHFKRVFSERQKPVDAPKAEVPRELVAEGIVSLPHLIAALGLAKSNGEARRLIEAGAVSLGEDKITDPRWTAPLEALLGKVLRVGKLQYRTLA
jgi:tyrosyl-tRNA synthetase